MLNHFISLLQALHRPVGVRRAGASGRPLAAAGAVQGADGAQLQRRRPRRLPRRPQEGQAADTEQPQHGQGSNAGTRRRSSM